MAKEYPVGKVFLAENSRTYWGVVEMIERLSLQTGPGGAQQPSPREYRLVNGCGCGAGIILSEEAISFSLREIPEIGLELQTLETSVKESPQQSRNLNGVILALANWQKLYGNKLFGKNAA